MNNRCPGCYVYSVVAHGHVRGCLYEGKDIQDIKKRAEIRYFKNNSYYCIVRYLDYPENSYDGWSQPCSPEEAKKFAKEYINS